MKKQLTKFFSLIVAAACLASPLSLSASHCHRDRDISVRDVAGTYQMSGFSNSFSTAPLNFEAQALIGQITLNKDSTAVINFGDITLVDTAGTIIAFNATNVQGTYLLGPNNGQAAVTFVDFPFIGETTVYAVSFKKHDHKVVGFSALTTVNGFTNLVTLIQGERFN